MNNTVFNLIKKIFYNNKIYADNYFFCKNLNINYKGIRDIIEKLYADWSGVYEWYNMSQQVNF
jgi:hypothetical protein